MSSFMPANPLLRDPNPLLSGANPLLSENRSLNPLLSENALLAKGNRLSANAEAACAKSNRMVQEQLLEGIFTPEFAEEVQLCVRAFSREWQDTMEHSKRQIEIKFEDYVSATGEITEKFKVFVLAEADRLIAGEPMEQMQIDRAKHFVYLVEHTRKIYMTAVQDAQALCEKNAQLVQNNYKDWINFVYSERLKKLEIVTALLLNAHTQEKHEMEALLGYHEAEMKQEEHEFNQFVEEAKLLLQADKQKKDYSIQRSNVQIERHKLDEAIQMARQQLILARQQESHRHREALTQAQNEREIGMRRVHNERRKAEAEIKLAKRQIAVDEQREHSRHKETMEQLSNSREVSLRRVRQEDLKARYESLIQKKALQLGYEKIQSQERLQLARLLLPRIMH